MHFREDEQAQRPTGAEDEVTQHAYMREEREGEVHLYFQNIPADRVAHHFWSLGAQLITLMAERADEGGEPAREQVDRDEPGIGAGNRSQRKRAPHYGQDQEDKGELTMRYFFALGPTVYTVDIAVPSGVVESVSAIYPSAARLEREAAERMAAVIRSS